MVNYFTRLNNENVKRMYRFDNSVQTYTISGIEGEPEITADNELLDQKIKVNLDNGLFWKYKPKRMYSFIFWNEETKTMASKCIKYIEMGKFFDIFKDESINNNFKQELYILNKKIETWERLNYLSDKICFKNSAEIMIGNLRDGPKYATSLKKSIDYTIRYKTAATEIDIPEDVTIFKDVEDINCIFPSRHLINFQIEDNYEDAEWSLQETPCKMDDDTLGALREIMIKNIKDNKNLRFFDTLDSINLSNEKKCFENNKSVKSFNARVESGFNDSLAYELNFLVKQVTKSPEEDRVILIGDIESRNLIYIVREMTSDMHKCKYDVYGRNRWEFYNFLKRDRKRMFLLADQKKFGPVFPRYLLVMYFDILIEMYPDYTPFKLIRNIYNENRIYFHMNNKKIKTLRGFILGMFDNIGGFIVSCIFELFINNFKKIHDEDDVHKVDAIFWGDDQAIRIDNHKKHFTMRLWNEWLTCQENYGMIINRKKSFISKRGIFCEVYSPDYPGEFTCEKKAIYVMQPFQSLQGINKFHCKTLWSAHWDYYSRTIPWYDQDYNEPMRKTWRRSLQESMNIIGYEFSPDEAQIPFQLGGWVYPRDVNGKSDLLRIVWEKEYDPKFYAIGCLKYEKLHIRKKLLRKLDSLLDMEYFKGILDHLDLKFLNVDFKNMLITQLREHVRLGSGNFEKEKAWKMYQDLRAETWYKNVTKTRAELRYHLYWEKEFKECYPNIDFFDSRRYDHLVPDSIKTTIDDSCWIKPERAILLFMKKTNKFISDVKFLKESYISLKDCVRSVYKDLAQCGYPVPVDWFIWLHNQGVDINAYYLYYKRLHDVNIFEYYCPFAVDTSDTIKDFGTTDICSKSIYWDEFYGAPIIADHIWLYGCPSNWNAIKYLQLNSEDYFRKAEIRSEKDVDLVEEEEEPPDEIKAEIDMLDDEFLKNFCSNLTENSLMSFSMINLVVDKEISMLLERHEDDSSLSDHDGSPLENSENEIFNDDIPEIEVINQFGGAFHSEDEADDSDTCSVRSLKTSQANQDDVNSDSNWWEE